MVDSNDYQSNECNNPYISHKVRFLKATSHLESVKSSGSVTTTEGNDNETEQLKMAADDEFKANENSTTFNNEEVESTDGLNVEQQRNEEMILTTRQISEKHRESNQEDQEVNGPEERSVKVPSRDITEKRIRKTAWRENTVEMNSSDNQTRRKTKRKLKQMFECDECQQEFHKRNLLHNHRFIYHKSTKIECKVCGKLFPTDARLLRHSSIHEGHKCPQCDHRYMKISDLNRHLSIDHVSLVSCPDCGRTFRHKQRLRKHRKIHEPNALRIPCTYEDCPRSYTLKRNLDAHIRSFHLGQRYPCTVSDCTFILSTKQKLEAHLRLHSLQRVEPHFSREPRDDSARDQREQRRAEELRLRMEALRERHRASTSWWEGSSVNEDSNLESDSSVSKFLKEDQPTTERTKEALRKKKRKRRRRSQSRHCVDLDKTTDCGTTTGVESDVN